MKIIVTTAPNALEAMSLLVLNWLYFRPIFDTESNVMAL